MSPPPLRWPRPPPPAQPPPPPRKPPRNRPEFTVVLTGAGEKKINVIKEVRGVRPDLGLKEAKDLVEGAPQNIKENVSKQEAADIKAKLEAAGASVTVQPGVLRRGRRRT